MNTMTIVLWHWQLHGQWLWPLLSKYPSSKPLAFLTESVQWNGSRRPTPIQARCTEPQLLPTHTHKPYLHHIYGWSEFDAQWTGKTLQIFWNPEVFPDRPIRTKKIEVWVPFPSSATLRIELYLPATTNKLKTRVHF